jgi:hypothetical protein
LAPLGRAKLGIVKLDWADDAAAWLDSLADNSADGAADDDWVAAVAVDAVAAAEPPQADRVARSAPVANVVTIQRVPMWISSRSTERASGLPEERV